MKKNAQKIIITGGSGFIGRCLSKKLLGLGYQVVSLDLAPSSIPGVVSVIADISIRIPKSKALENPRAIINLAGRSIFCRFTKKHKREIYDSRILGTKNLVHHMCLTKYKPKVFLSASAVGFYGNKPGQIINELTESGNTFLATVATEWEKHAAAAGSCGTLVRIIRQSHVLGKSGLLGVLQPKFCNYLGATLAKGDYFMPWIHVGDLVDLYVSLIKNPGRKKLVTINASAPEWVTQKAFSYALAETLNRPLIFNVPKTVLWLLFGEFADEMTVDQKIYPKELIDRGFRFSFPKLSQALKSLYPGGCERNTRK